MPELPEVSLYIDALERRVLDRTLERLRIPSASLLKTYDPTISEAEGQRVTAIQRIGKRIVWALEDEDYLIFHLMIAGRFQWKARGAPVPKKRAHAAFDFPNGTLLLTEAGTKKRASLHFVRGDSAVAQFDRGGVDVLEANLEEFSQALRRENRTLKRALTDPRILDGIGNAHSDEVLFEARLSPVKRTSQLTDDEIAALYEAARRSLAEWIERLKTEAGDTFPKKVTAFHPAMKVHGRYDEPCSECASPIQRIVYANNETNYCARCQTGGRLLRDRAVSRLLGEDWPRTLEELED